MIIEGRKISQEIINELKKLPKPKKFFGAVLVGSDAPSISFLKQKEKVAQELGIDFRLYKFPTEIKQDELRKEVLKIALHRTCGGAVVQLPLPEHINRQYVLNVIPREKDIDVLGERALGAFYAGRNMVLPPAVGVVEEILKTMNYELRIMKIAVIGSGLLVGKPIATWLQNKAAEIIIFNEYTKNLKDKLKDADIIISGVGEPNLFSGNDVKENSLIIDFGYSINKDGKIRGDFNPVIHDPQFIIHYTSAPGGTGPILVAKIFENFYKLNSILK